MQTVNQTQTMLRSLLVLASLIFFFGNLSAQKDFYQDYIFSQADSLRGQLRHERTCYDVTYYELNIGIDVSKQFIKGYVDIYFDVLENTRTIQLDLFENMTINEISWYDQPVTYTRLHNAVFVHFPDEMEKGFSSTLRVAYEGYPVKAPNAPWDGGFAWKQDAEGNPWVGVACEGDGASLWWPCKDHLSDEPDSMLINVAVPVGLVCISNGNLRKTNRLNDGYNVFSWFVSYPINSYNVTVNIGKYVHFSDTYIAMDGDSLQCDYYVLPYNLEKAKKHFKQVHDVLRCYEHYFGKYPFWNDGYALVETPYLGMEHQSCIAYGNNYKRGYLGGMIPRDMDWDYIIVHETGHEYFGNAVSVRDHAEMWIHESFTTYMEALFVEYTMSYDDAVRYLESQRHFIRNLEPILGPMDVNFDRWRASDHYFKGAWILHTLRNAIGDDELFFSILRNFYDRYKYKTCTTKDFIDIVNEKTGLDWTPFFQQYLTYPGVPRLLYDVQESGKDLVVKFKWEADVPGFDMPVLVGKKGNYTRIKPVTTEVREVRIPNLSKDDFEVADELFYIRRKRSSF
ncbi:MAG: M1 family metallopeptidase [Saprospiraceae bacterium]